MAKTRKNFKSKRRNRIKRGGSVSGKRKVILRGLTTAAKGVGTAANVTRKGAVKAANVTRKVAKTTGRGVATAAKTTGRGVATAAKATGKGVALAGQGVAAGALGAAYGTGLALKHGAETAAALATLPAESDVLKDKAGKFKDSMQGAIYGAREGRAKLYASRPSPSPPPGPPPGQPDSIDQQLQRAAALKELKKNTPPPGQPITIEQQLQRAAREREAASRELSEQPADINTDDLPEVTTPDSPEAGVEQADSTETYRNQLISWESAAFQSIINNYNIKNTEELKKILRNISNSSIRLSNKMQDGNMEELELVGGATTLLNIEDWMQHTLDQLNNLDNEEYQNEVDEFKKAIQSLDDFINSQGNYYSTTRNARRHRPDLFPENSGGKKRRRNKRRTNKRKN